MMPETKADVAGEGRPGRTTIVGRRMIRPSTKPRREYSLTKSSAISLPQPYEPSGQVMVSGETSWGWE
jgi:hypothetical protein